MEAIWYKLWRDFTMLLFLLFTVTDMASGSLTECFYEIGTIRGVTYLGSIFCKYGCCGTSQDQRCCSREEKYPDEDEGRTWRIVALAFAGVIIVLALSLVACWIMKKKNKKIVRIRATNYSATGATTPVQRPRYMDQPDIFAINLRETTNTNLQPPSYSYLPKYSETVNNPGNRIQNGYPDGNGATGSGNAHGNGNDNTGGPPHSHEQRPVSPPPSYAP